jgi:hypothetical protein
MNMLRKSATCAAIALLLAATGCARETAAKTEADVTKAEAAGAQDVAAVRNDATDTMADAQMKVATTQEEMARKAADTNQTLAIAEAQAAHKVSIERCEAQTGDARTACKKLADVELTDATARADAVKAAAYPNG